jgi:uncharacterized membrane protein YphA (DoxX/SURF4 family)
MTGAAMSPSAVPAGELRVSTQPPRSVKPDVDVPVWTAAQKFWFRAMFVFIGIYTIDRIDDYWIPRSTFSAEDYWWIKIFNWGQYVIQKPASWLAHKFVAACPASFSCWPETIIYLAALAIVAAGIWTYLDRSRPNYIRLYQWLRFVVRYWLAYIMWMYAWMKWAGVQFQVGPDADDLIKTVGETSKMRLMWGTMGYSATYALFTAVGETVGAALVLWRRTTTIGALVIAVIMLNVCFLDIAHHVGGVAEASLMYMLQALVLVGGTGCQTALRNVCEQRARHAGMG